VEVAPEHEIEGQIGHGLLEERVRHAGQAAERDRGDRPPLVQTPAQLRPLGQRDASLAEPLDLRKSTAFDSVSGSVDVGPVELRAELRGLGDVPRRPGTIDMQKCEAVCGRRPP
jgi:hypothetical protein